MVEGGGFRIKSREEVNACFVQLEDLQEKTDNPYAQRIQAFIRRDLVGKKNIRKFMPGNEIKVSGILKEIPVILRTGAISTRFDHALEVISVEELQTEINIEDFSKEEIKKNKRFININRQRRIEGNQLLICPRSGGL